MKFSKRRQRWLTAPKCFFCDILTEPTIIYYDDDCMVKGWKCPHCGFTLINPTDIPTALDLVRETAKV